MLKPMIRPATGPSNFRAEPTLISNWSRVSFCWRNSCRRLISFFNRRRRLFLVTACATASQDVELSVLFAEFPLNSVADLCPRLGQKLLLEPPEPSARRAHQIVYRRLGRPHLGQHLFRWDAAIHHPGTPGLAILR